MADDQLLGYGRINRRRPVSDSVVKPVREVLRSLSFRRYLHSSAD